MQMTSVPIATEWQKSAPSKPPSAPSTSVFSRFSARAKLIAAIILILIILVGGAIALWISIGRNAQPAVLSSQSAQNFKTLDMSLAGIDSSGVALGNQTLNVNGQLRTNGSLIMTPSVRPSQPITGQLYYDQTNDHLSYYNGQVFVQLQTNGDVQGTNTTVNNNTTNTTNLQVLNNTTNTTVGGGVDTSGFARLAATQTFSGANTFKTNSTAALDVQTAGGTSLLTVNTASSSVTVGATNAVSTVTLGSATGTSTTTLQGGTGNLSVTTGATTGSSGSISIATGNSSTTASGNISIDNGSGIIDGQVISDKTFESGLDNLQAWFGSTVAQSTAQAHSGTHSLAETGTAANEGVIENINNPIAHVTPGHQYFFSFWIRAATTPRTMNIIMNWQSGSSTIGTVPMTPTADTATGWTQVTGVGTAPGGATGVWVTVSHLGAVNEVHYFDDFTITDLSSSSAFSAMSIGATNAKMVTIGNLNQIGATSILGGSGINLNSGAGSLAMSGGAISISGSAASTIGTSGGALTITAATSSTWGIGTPATGNGGNLTLKGANGGSGNGNGGNLLLQGGLANGTGLGGSVIVKPLTDSTTAFQVQDSAGTPLLEADTTVNKTLTVKGTTTAFATLGLSNAHFSSTQTNAPTVSTPANCGTTPSASVTAGSTDSAGSFVVTAGSGAVAGPCAVTLTFNQTYGTAPKSVIITPTTAVGTSPQGKAAIVSATTATNFTTTITPANPATSEVNSYYYWVIK